MRRAPGQGSPPAASRARAARPAGRERGAVIGPLVDACGCATGGGWRTANGVTPRARPSSSSTARPGRVASAPQPEATAELGARLITFDRPGYGGSDVHEGRELVDTPADVRRARSTALGVDDFAVIGVSAGGAHALAYRGAAARPRDRASRCVERPGPARRGAGSVGRARRPLYRPTARMARHEPARVGAGDGPIHGAVRRRSGELRRRRNARRPGRGRRPRAPGRCSLADAAEAFRTSGAGHGRRPRRPVAAVGLCRERRARRRPPVARRPRTPGPSPTSAGSPRPCPGPVTEIWPDQGHLGVVARWPEVLGRVLSAA